MHSQKIGCAVNEAAKADTTNDAIEISVTGVANHRQGMQRAEPCGILTLLNCIF